MTETVHGTKGSVYEIDKYFFGNSSIYSSNLPSGIFDISSCRFGPPIFISQPHFYQADPYYRRLPKAFRFKRVIHWKWSKTLWQFLIWIRGISDEKLSNFCVTQGIGRLEFEDGLRTGRYPPGVLLMPIWRISALSPHSSQSTYFGCKGWSMGRCRYH